MHPPVSKRLYYFRQRDEAVLNVVLRIYLWVIAQSLRTNMCTSTSAHPTVLEPGPSALRKPEKM